MFRPVHKHANPEILPSIDALRALAILGVVFSHVMPRTLQGGFLGVDAFFVVSGFLITRSSIGPDLGIDILKFWRRRIARIVPALLIVTVATTLVAWFIFVLPKDREDYFASLPYQAVFAQNHFFSLRRIDYFYGLEEAKLNLHLWSIAVEEQFYLAFPLLIAGIGWVATSRRWSLLVALVTAVLLVSLLLPPSFVRIFGEAYYVMPFRAWELALGVLVALTVARFHIPQIPGSIALELLAIAAIVIPMAIFDRTTGHFSLLFPCIGTTVLVFLAATKNAPTLDRLGSNSVISLVGKASYSLYLWHWPLYAALKYTNFEFGKTWFDITIYLALLGLLSAASFILIEQLLRPRLHKSAFVVLAVFVLSSVSLSLLPPRQPSGAVSAIIDSSRMPKDCADTCEHGSGERVLLLWGDSHAHSLWDVAGQVADREGLKLVGYGRWMPGRRDTGEAEKFHQYALKLKDAGKLEAIIISSRWSMYAVGFPKFEPQEYGSRFFARNGVIPSSQSEMTETWKATMGDFLTDFANVNIIAVLQVPQFPFFPPKDMAMQELGLRVRPLPAKLFADHKEDNVVVNQYFHSAAATNSHLTIVDPASVLCDAIECRPRRGNKSLYYDDDHISALGASLLQPLFNAAFDKMRLSAVELPKLP